MKLLLEWLVQGATVVTATPRQTLQLRWQFDRHQAAAGRGGWRAPQILPLSAWFEETWQQAVIDGTPSGRRRLLAPLQTQLLWQALGTEVVGEHFALQTSSELLQQAQRLVADWHLDERGLQQAALRGDERQFVALLTAYRRRCAALEAVDRAEWCWLLSEDLGRGRLRPAVERIVFCGFAAWPPSLDRLQAALQTAGVDARRHQPVLAGRTVGRAHYADVRAEQTAVIQWAADRFEQHADVSIGIVLPDAAEQGTGIARRLLDLVQPDWRARPAAQRPVVATSRSESLARLEPVTSALGILALSGPVVDYREFAALLRSPCLGGSESEADARARLDLKLREISAPRVNHWQLQHIVQRYAPRFGRALVQLLDATRASPARQAPAAWVKWLDQRLRAFGWPGDAPRGASEEALRQRWRELLDQLAGCAELTGSLSLAEFRELLTRLAAEQGAGSEQRGGGIAVLHPEEALGQAFDGLWIAGLHADAWPPVRRPNPLLPLALQRAAGIPEASPAGLAGHAQRLLQMLCKSTPLVQLSCADSEAELRLTPSPLLAGLPELAPAMAARPSVQERLFWSAELEAVASDPAPALGSAERARGGARLLQLEALCPARAFFELRLGAKALEIPVSGISAKRRGTLLHAAVEQLYQALHAAGLEPGEAGAQALVSAAVAAVTARSPPGADALTQATVELEAQRIEQTLRRLLAWDAARPPFRFLAAEQCEQIELGSLRLDIRSDRVDELPGGGWLVIDYKSGDSQRLAWGGERPAEPQLPLYAVAAGGRVRALAIVQLGPRELRAKGIADDPQCLPELDSVGDFSRGAVNGWQEQLALWEENLRRIADEFAGGSCLINLNDTRLAGGQYAPLTRLVELAGPGAE